MEDTLAQILYLRVNLKKALLTNLYLYNVKPNTLAYYTRVQISEEKGFKDGPNTLAY